MLNLYESSNGAEYPSYLDGRFMNKLIILCTYRLVHVRVACPLTDNTRCLLNSIGGVDRGGTALTTHSTDYVSHCDELRVGIGSARESS